MNPKRYLLLICILSLPSLVNGQIYYVKANGTGDGSSWANASGDLQAIINETNPGDDIWIAEGTYFPTECLLGNCNDSTDFAFSFPFDSIALYGGFPNSGDPNWADRDWDLYPTILSGNTGDPNSDSDNVKNVVRSLHIFIDGLIVSDAKEEGIYADHNGNFYLTNCWVRNNQGGEGGIYADGGYIQLTNCKISENQADGIESFADIKMTNCQISNNQGRGIFSDAADIELINCEVSNNQGKGISCHEGCAELTNCQINNNQGTGVGVYEKGCLHLYYCRISNNAGRIASTYNDDEDSFIKFYNCIFDYNGGGLYSDEVRGENSLFIGNTTNQSGGAIYSTDYTKVKNCTFVNNSAEVKGAAIYSEKETEIINCIFWGNHTSGTAKTIDCNPTDDNFISYVLTDEADCESLGSNITCGDGMIFNADDPFVSIGSEDFQLHGSSQAINAGDNSSINPTSYDLNNLPRIQSNIVDIGAYEYSECSFYFSRQSQIDSFPLNYPALDTVECDVYIRSGNEDPITNLENLSQLQAIKGFLWIERNSYLIELAGLENLDSIGGHLFIQSNSILSSLSGLDGLKTINGNLYLSGNTLLVDISALNNLDPSGIIKLVIWSNGTLAICHEPFVCNYLDLGGPTSISNNAFGCSSEDEIAEACLVGISKPIDENIVSIYPNPTSNQIQIVFQEPIKGTYELRDLSGKLLMQSTLHQNTTIDLNNLAQGVYVLILKTDDGTWIERILKL